MNENYLPEYTEKDEKIEDLNIEIENLLNAKKSLEKALNDINDIDEASDLVNYLEQDITEINNILDKLNDEMKELVEEPNTYENEYEERMKEYREMQGF